MMKADYIFRITDKLEELLLELKVFKKAFSLLPEFPHIEENLRRQSILKSSLFSARIEGNRLSLEDVRYEDEGPKSESKAKTEIFNIMKAQRWLRIQNQAVDISIVKKLHLLVMSDLSSDAGVIRTEQSAIFNQAGVAVYLTPPPQDLPKLLNDFINYINSQADDIPLTAGKAHFQFEKIHPFIDGNGRVGRLISSYILYKGGYDFRGLVSFEQYLDENRDRYYFLLSERGKDITLFQEFFLQALVAQAKKALEELKNYREERKEDNLLPRRREILEIIRDHPAVSFDFLRRRFLKVAPSTLHYDIGKLLQAGLIRKLGSTRGVAYEAR